MKVILRRAITQFTYGAKSHGTALVAATIERGGTEKQGGSMARRCKHSQCRTELLPARQCTDIIQKRGFCDVECLTAHTRESMEEKRLKGIRKAMNPNPPKPKKKSQTELTQQVFNRMIRLLDEGKPCISCGRSQFGSYWDAGHYRSVGSCPEIRFDPRNCHIQGSGCNRANRRPDKNNANRS